MEQTYIEEKEVNSGFDVKRFFSKLVRNYYWFIITVAVFGTSAYLYIRYTPPFYEVSTYILIKQPNDASAAIGASPFAQQAGVNPAGTALNFTDPANEIFKLKSEALIGEVVDSLNLCVSAVKFGRVKSKAEEVDSLPFAFTVIKASPENRFPLHKLTLSPTSFTLQSEANRIKGYYGQPLLIGGDTMIITLKAYASNNFNNIYGVSYSGRSSAISEVSSRITVAPATRAGAGMLQISVRDELPKRAKKIIDVLINAYDLSNLQFKNKALRMEIDFLNERVSAIGNELLHQENIVRDFKVAHRVTDVSSSANQLLVNLTTLDAKKNENESKKYLADLVENNIKNFTGQEQVISNAAGLGDAVLTTLVSKYNEKVLEKKRILDKGTALDPRLPGIDTELQDLRISILNSVNNLKTELKSNNEFLAAQERSTTSRFSTMPEKEKDYVQVNRLLGLKQTMYIFLLQRKEDKHIQLVSSQIGESRVIDSRVNRNILYPKPMIIYGGALGLSLLLPALIILIRMLLNKKVETRKDIENATSIPIAGEIEMEPSSKKNVIVSAGYRSDVAEQFRSLRTNLLYLKQETAGKILMVTSSMSGEGKSFVSLNLANTLALTGKKVVLIEFDLRRPQLSKKLNIKIRPGLTDYLITDDIHPRDIVHTTADFEHLSFVTCGPIPPNPGELILNKKVQTFFEYLRNHYDYVVVDTPPVGIVSDAIIIGKWVDLTLFIVRHHHTFRSSLQLLNELKEEKKLPHLSIIINSIKRNKGFHREIQGTYNYYLKDEKIRESKNGMPASKKEHSSI